MTIREALRIFNTVEDIDLLLARALRGDKEYLYMNPNKVLNSIHKMDLAQLISDRKKGVPVAYLLRYKYFCGLQFKVTPGVLIPRPESEWLVDRAGAYIKESSNHKKTLKVLDVGTGSGCLLIALAKLHPDITFELTGIDISSAALTVARANAKKHGVRASFLKSDLLDKVTGEYDVIFANLPYVPLSDYRQLESNLQYEPADAITAHDETWKIYDRFLEQAVAHIKPGSLILLEIDPKQKPTLQKTIKKWIPDANVEFAKDIHTLWRYCVIN